MIVGFWKKERMWEGIGSAERERERGREGLDKRGERERERGIGCPFPLSSQFF